MKEFKTPAEHLREIWLRQNQIEQLGKEHRMLSQLHEDIAARSLQATAASAAIELERSLADAWTPEKILSRIGVNAASASELLTKTVQQHEAALQRHLLGMSDPVGAEAASIFDLAINAWPRVGSAITAVPAIGSALRSGPVLGAIATLSENRLSISDLVDELASRQAQDAAREADESRPPTQHINPLGDDHASYGAPVVSRGSSAEKLTALRSIPTIVILFVIALIGHIAAWESLRESIVDLSARLPQTSSLAAAKKFVRQHLSGKPGDVRLTKIADLELRESPDMKSGVVMRLPLYAPVVVLDKQDRTWRLVEYTHEGYVVEGYVSAKFLAKARRD